VKPEEQTATGNDNYKTLTPVMTSWKVWHRSLQYLSEHFENHETQTCDALEWIIQYSVIKLHIEVLQQKSFYSRKGPSAFVTQKGIFATFCSCKNAVLI